MTMMRMGILALALGLWLGAWACGSSGASGDAGSVTTLVALWDSEGASIASTTSGNAEATNVPTDTKLEIGFLYAQDPPTVTSSLTLTCGGTGQSFTVTASSDNKNFTVDPDNDLPAKTSCTMTTSLYGSASFSFTTAEADPGSSSGDTTAPTISSVTISGGNATPSATSLSTSTSVTNVSAATSSFTVTFSEAMDETTLVSRNFALVCDYADQSFTFSTTSSRVAVVTPSAAMPQETSCTLIVGKGVKDSAGNALAANASYTFTTGCTTNDSFGNSATLSACWAANNTVSTAATVSIANGVLSMSTSVKTTFPPNIFPYEYKTFGSGNIVATMAVPTFSGIANSKECGFFIWDASSITSALTFSIASDGGKLRLSAMPLDGAPEYTAYLGTGSSSAALSGTLYLRVTQSGTRFTPSYRIGSSGSFTDMSPITRTVGTSTQVGLWLNGNGNVPVETINCQFDDFSVSGVSATGQD